MSDFVIKTDGKWRNLLYGYELPKSQRKNFDYIKNDEEYANSNFVKYRGHYYDVNEFMWVDNWSTVPFGKSWDGYYSETYFSGVVVKLSKDGERYKVGRYYQ